VNIQFTSGKFYATDNNGAPAVGYKIWAYKSPDTSTPAVSYSNQECTVANNWPVVLDSRGEAFIYVKIATDFYFTSPTAVDISSPIWESRKVGAQPVSPIIGSATPVTLNNNYIVTTVPTVTALYNSFQLVMTPDLNNASTLVSTVFTGTGINDLTASGAYLGSTSGSVFTFKIDSVVHSAPVAPTAALSATAGLVTAGNHYVKLTAVTVGGETIPGAASAVVAADGTHKIDVSGIPAIAGDITGYKIYMTKAGGSTYYFVATVITTTYAINTVDANLTVVAPTNGVAADTFTWKKDGGAWHPGIAITGVAQAIMEGLVVISAVITGHTFGDIWAVTVKTPARVNLDTLGNLLVYKNKGGSVVALDGNDMLAGYPAQLILNEALNAWLLTNPATPIFSVPTITANRYRKNITTTYAMVAGDEGYELSCVGTFTVTLLTPPQFSGRFFYIKNAGTGLITLDAGIYNIYGNGTSTFTIGPGGCFQLQSNGVDWHILTSLGFPMLISQQDVSAATSATFTALIPGVKYRLIYELTQNTSTGKIGIRFNGDAGANYQSIIDGVNTIGTTFMNASTTLIHTAYEVGVTYIATATIDFTTHYGNNKMVKVAGSSGYTGIGATFYFTRATISSRYTGASDLTSVAVIVDVGTFTGRVWLYQVG